MERLGLRRRPHGAHPDRICLAVERSAGRRYRFRYLLDGYRWENDWAADDSVPNGFGSEDSVVDLTILPQPLPAPLLNLAPLEDPPAKGETPAAIPLTRDQWESKLLRTSAWSLRC